VAAAQRRACLSLTLGLGAIVLVGWAVGVVLQVLAHQQLLQVDELVQRFFSGHGVPWLAASLRAAAGLGGAGLLLAVGLAAGLAFRLAGGRWQPLGLLLAAYGGAELLALIVQALIRRPRPPSMLVPASGFAFPFREATAAAGVYGLLAVLAAARTAAGRCGSPPGPRPCLAWCCWPWPSSTLAPTGSVTCSSAGH